MLLYAMGEDTEETLLLTNLSAELKEHADYQKVIEKFGTFFHVRRNLIFKRARFNKRCQADGESVEQFSTCLYRLADQCDFGDLQESMIRDRIVVI